MNPAPNLVLIGPMGAGKTSIGKRLAERFGLRFIDVDHEIVGRCGASVPAIFAHEGEAGFRKREREVLAAILAGNGQLVSTGGGAVLDEENRACMRERGFVVWLKVGVEAQLKRVGHDKNRPLLNVADRAQTLRELAARREPLYAHAADICLDTDALSPHEATIALVQQLARQWQRSDLPNPESATQ